jgi:hypothetical protein
MPPDVIAKNLLAGRTCKICGFCLRPFSCAKGLQDSLRKLNTCVFWELKKSCSSCKHGEDGVCYNYYGIQGVTEISDGGYCRNWEAQ